MYRLALVLAVALCLPYGCGPQAGGVLTTIGQIRSLRSGEAESGYPVRLRGVATYYHEESKFLVLQAGAEGVFVDTGKTEVDVSPGREIQVEGITGPGDSSPIVIATDVKNLAAETMPAAAPVSIDELSSGSYSYRRVQAEGIVRSGSRENDGRLTLRVETAGGVFQARINVLGPAPIDRFVDSRVRIRGVADTMFSTTGQAIRVQVLVSDIKDIEVIGASVSPSASTHAQPVTLTVLRTVSEIRGLSPAEARRGHPIHLRAVVTTIDGVDGNAFIQDATAGIYMVNGGKRLAPGQLVEVLGQTGPGNFAPVIDKARVRVIGRAELPAPVRLPLSDLFTGQYDSQFVQAEGIVQSVGPWGAGVYLALVSGPYSFRVFLADGSGGLPSALVDTKIRVRGACGAIFNERRQLLGIRVQVPGLKYITVLEPAPADSFALPVQPVNTLMHFSPGSIVGHRVRMQGIATLRRASGVVYIKDNTGGLVIHTLGNVPVNAGDRLDIVGFATPGDYLPELRSAVIQKQEPGVPPPAVHITADEAQSGNYHAQLVQMEAVMVDQTQNSAERVLNLRSGRRTFNAFLENTSDAQNLNARTSGVYLRAEPTDLSILDGRDDQKRVELIAERLKNWKSMKSA